MKHFRIAALPWFGKGADRRVVLMVPSNPAYGGHLPQLAKGHKHAEETELAAAIREAGEELGLKPEAIVRQGMRVCGPVQGQGAYYEIRAYIIEVTGPEAFSSAGYETGEVKILQIEDALAQARPEQQALLRHALEAIEVFG